MRILGFGDNIFDHFVDRETVYPGGNCVNVAVFARALGADAAYLGVFGSDGYGELMRAALAAEGVDYDRSVVRAGASGISLNTVEDGDRVFGDWNGGGVTVAEPLVLDDGLVAYASEFDLVHSSVYSGSEAELPKLASGGALLSYDLSSEDGFRSPGYLDRVCPFLDLALVSGSHLSDQESRDLLRDIVARGATLALATRGTLGAMVYDGRVFVEAPAEIIDDPSQIVDTMGCGDAYLAAFVVTLLDAGWSRSAQPSPSVLQDALAAGAVFAAKQCFTAGAFGHGTHDVPELAVPAASAVEFAEAAAATAASLAAAGLDTM